MNIKTTRIKQWLLPCLILSSLVTKAQQPFGAGNLVIERVGDGSTALSGIAAPVFLDEYTPAGMLVQSIAMPTATSGNNHMLTESGSATSDGFLHLSPDGKYLAIPGYDATVGTTGVASTTSASVARVVGIVNSQGVVSTTAAFNNIASGANTRSAITTDSINIWIGGGGSGGVYYGTAASATAVNLSTTSNNVRCVNIFNGQLYTTSSSGAIRMAAVGTGLPTTAGQTIVNLTGMPISGGSPNESTMATLSNGSSIIYIADDGVGIMKYSNISGTWTAKGSVGSSSDAYRGVTCYVRNDSVFLYATSGTKMVAIVDGNGLNTAISSSNTTVTTLATVSANKVFRGIAFAPNCAAPTINTAPTAQSTCVGGNATFTVAASGSNLTYQWMKDGNAITGANTNSYTITGAATTDAGNYSVAVTSCSSTTTTPVALTVAAPTATITAASTTTFCTGGSVVLNANTGTGLTYQWSNGTNITGATNASYTANAAGTYTVTVSNGTCSATSTATTVTVNPLPAATINAAGPTAICAGSSVVLNANTGTGLTYQWKNGTNITGATNASFTASAAATLTVVVSNGTCSATSAATVITVNPAPTATITAAGSTNLCTGGSVVLNANTGTGLTYQWMNGANAINGASTASYTANAAGSYTVVVSNGTCTATSAATTVNVLNGTGATITPAGPTTFCAGSSVVLNANTGTGLTYQWSNGTNITGATNASYTATAAGSYTVTVSNGSCSSTSTATTVAVNPAPTATITAATATTFCT
ncbi:beta strand repeat-containing protein, partial [Taibaiella soli]